MWKVDSEAVGLWTLVRSCRGHGGETGEGIETAGGVEGDFHVDGFVAVGMEELVVDLVADFEG